MSNQRESEQLLAAIRTNRQRLKGDNDTMFPVELIELELANGLARAKELGLKVE